MAKWCFFFFKFSFKVPHSSFILIIATLKDYQNTKLSVTGLGGIERYHRLDLFNKSIFHQGKLCVNYDGKEVAIKSMSRNGDWLFHLTVWSDNLKTKSDLPFKLNSNIK